MHGNQIGTIEAKTFKLQDGGNSIDIGDNIIGEIAHKAFVLPATTGKKFSTMHALETLGGSHTEFLVQFLKQYKEASRVPITFFFECST